MGNEGKEEATRCHEELGWHPGRAHVRYVANGKRRGYRTGRICTLIGGIHKAREYCMIYRGSEYCEWKREVAYTTESNAESIE
jgi:hypothetical protein